MFLHATIEDLNELCTNSRLYSDLGMRDEGSLVDVYQCLQEKNLSFSDIYKHVTEGKFII